MISETKKNDIEPIKIAVVTVVSRVIVKANTLVIIEPIILVTKKEFVIQSHKNLFLPKITMSNPISDNIAKIKVIKINTSIVSTRPEKNTAAIPAATRRLAIMLKAHEQVLFFSLYINIPPIVYNMICIWICVYKVLIYKIDFKLYIAIVQIYDIMKKKLYGGITMELKGSKTEQNLMTAFAGESQARNKYTYYASKAKKEGYEQIAALILETADNEKGHAK